MKILLVSDSHRDDKVLQLLVKQYPDMDLYLHAGDSQSDECSILPFYSIRGNCDYYPFDEKRLMYTPHGYLLMKHHPRFTEEERKIAKILIYGHTHRYAVYEEGDNLYINPGSISLPRDNSEGSYAIIEINEEKVIVNIIDVFTKNILIHYEIM